MSSHPGLAGRSSSFLLCYADTRALPDSLKCAVNFAEGSGPGFRLQVGEAAEGRVWSQTAWV